MLKRLVAEATFIFLCFAIGISIFLLFDTQPSDQDLNNDLASVRTQIESSIKDSAKYSGGLIKSVIDARSEVAKVTEQMLLQKKAAFLRRINLNYSIDGKILSPSDNSRLQQISEDIAATKMRISEAQAEAARYSGGLILSLIQTRVETEKLQLEQLTLNYFAAKYGLAFPMAVQSPSSAKPVSPGSVVPDKDAL